ncbi:isocitrate lyase/phosphoenolpyruvate mutase family protein [Pseudomonas capsici]|uniref:isocitrate lyase/PEP mutase family protein n=1 Tax=Pseudomonas capsici TaxID=2810614 RepID=UPI0021F1C601|nr:isocitrate lyase/phosphoenolpyruvate mutase family protein [Pseudomonas capsici]MCV4261594.1 isocitrate lyase/phosphoenolpyruvate mutase family protein [Pseudomonas capsici]MCV4271710.1 isocitrate lyase/phosphoenolpyruvate mutase family protein [Pseudomonas capsici]MCV4289446.1 isocitrate lyase/phosphoenolpyruvate mutase family protein [Pseudomonas capsici]
MAALDHAFHNLHQDGLLVLANVADAGGARLVEHLGGKAVATSSAAMAWSHGYQDGNKLPLELLSTTIQSMVRVLTVPLTVDIEGGYSDDPKKVGEVINAVVAAGAVGINIEDGLGTPDLLVRKIDVARQVAQQSGVDLFINVRCDVYLKNLFAAELRLEELLKRAELYTGAGADGLFAAGVVDSNEIAAICQSTRLPVNLLSRDGLPSPDELKRLGVRRLSAGSSIAEFLYGAMGGLVRSFLDSGELDTHALKAHTYGELNALMALKKAV